MSQQKQIIPLSAPEATKTPSGNLSAKAAAEKANEFLSAAQKPKPPMLSASAAKAMAMEHFRNSETIPDVEDGCDGGINTLAALKDSGQLDNALSLINAGLIDPERMCWTDKAQAEGLLICFCLHPSCRIGHFIPFRSK